jgi:hypothetical protein
LGEKFDEFGRQTGVEFVEQKGAECWEQKGGEFGRRVDGGGAESGADGWEEGGELPNWSGLAAGFVGGVDEDSAGVETSRIGLSCGW